LTCSPPLDLGEICPYQAETGVIRWSVFHDGDMDTARKVLLEGSQGSHLDVL
jgi:hypothetical protein